MIGLAYSTLRVVPHAFWSKETDTDTPVIAVNGACSSGNTYANQVAVKILQAGGNAVDAAIAAALMIGVRNPFASGIGGGGIMLIHLENGTDLTIDCRETAPASSFPTIYSSNSFLSYRGGLSIGIPGELLCMDYAYKHYGSAALGTGNVQWAELFEAAISTAGNGFVVTPFLAKKLNANTTVITSDPGLRSIYTYPNGSVVQAGATVSNPLLAATLIDIASNGVDSFYRGALANTIRNEINSFGGQFVPGDLSNYTVEKNGFYNTTYRGLRVVGAPLPFAGSLMMMQTLNILETFPLPQLGYTADALHYIIEAAKFGFGNRVLLGDIHTTNKSTVSKMLSKTRAQTVLAANIKQAEVYSLNPLAYIDLADDSLVRGKKSYVWPHSDSGTTHISTVDNRRMAVAFTTSINAAWGSGCLGLNTGILYNNQLDDFSQPAASNPSFPNDPVNFPGPGKRPLSSMTPTLVFNGTQLVFVGGGAGGPKIFSGTLQTFLDVFDFGKNVKIASLLPRLHNQLNPDLLQYENFMVEGVIDDLQSRSHVIAPVSEPFNYINTVQVLWKPDGTSLLNADSDWRKDAVSAGY